MRNIPNPVAINNSLLFLILRYERKTIANKNPVAAINDILRTKSIKSSTHVNLLIPLDILFV